jgi:phosphoribosyl-ATP pyrophosphohydrolase
MNCVDYLELINLHIDGEITPEQEAQLQAHLADCAECRAMLADLQAIQSGVADLAAEPPERFAQGVMYRIAKETDGTGFKQKKFAFGRATALAAVAAVLVFLVGTGSIELPHRNAASSDQSAEIVMDSTTAAATSETTGERAAITGEADTGSETAESYAEIYAAVQESEGADADPTEEAAETAMADEASDSLTLTEEADSADVSYALYATLYGYDSSEPIPELSDLTQDAEQENCYYGTAAQIESIVAQYSASYHIECESSSEYAADDPACLVLVP